MVIGAPPEPFGAQAYTLPAGSLIYRVTGSSRAPNEFNPGIGGATRFAFFGDPPTPVLYAAQSEVAAVCETILHDVPAAGGNLLPHAYRSRIAARLTTARDLRLASFMGTGLRALRVEARDLTDSDPPTYPSTVRWAESAHRAGFDGVVWMSKRCNTDRAYVLFGDRVSPGDLTIDPDYARVFAAGPDLDWLVDLCTPMHIEVLIR